jgi:hypothetical protein
MWVGTHWENELLKPAFITFTGADERTNLAELESLCRDWPVEIGILFSKSRSPSPRYPSIDWISGLADRGLRLSAHLCGAWAAEVADNGTSEIEPLLAPFSRVQINVGPGADPGIVRTWADAASSRLGMHLEPILQSRGAAFPDDDRVSWLHDCSGGRGDRPAAWPAPALPGIRFGYAGGMGPENIREILAELPDAPDAWIDMESRIRNAADEFDIGLCRKVCEATYG